MQAYWANICLQTEDFLEDTVEDSNFTQTEPDVSVESIPAYAGMQSSDAGTQIETGDLPDGEAQAQVRCWGLRMEQLAMRGTAEHQ